MADDFRDPDLQHQIVAILAKGSRILGYGVNQLRHARRASYFYGSLHAEADLLRRHADKMRGAKIYVYRYNNAPASPVANQPLNARPCPLCSHMLRVAGVGKVVYVNDEGFVESVRGHQLQLLTEDPTILTRRFLDRMGHEHHGKFFVEKYLAT